MLNGITQAPTPVKQRIVLLDVLRGFALFGILVVNIMSFSGAWSGVYEWTGKADQIADEAVKFFFRGKFYTLFAMLFGFGFAMQAQRFNWSIRPFALFYLRRMLILFLIGMLHMLLEPLDILKLYALCGITLLLFVNARPNYLLLWALIIMTLPYLHTAIISTWEMNQSTTDSEVETLQLESHQARSFMVNSSQETEQEEIEEEEEEEDDADWNPYRGEKAVQTYGEGNLRQVLSYNLNFSLYRFTDSWVGYLWMTTPLPLMLIGLYFGRKFRLSLSNRPGPKIRWFCGLSLGVGIVITWWSGIIFEQATAAGWDAWLWFLGSIVWVLGGWVLSLGYALVLCLLWQRTFWKNVLEPLAAVGRLSLTNYLGQTIILVLIFYSFGLGLYGKVGPALAVVLVVTIYSVQVVFSILWAKRYRFGPVEWLWRSMTYGSSTFKK